ncbi:MAG: transporter [Glaciihabitans sp.]|nr:transporter [Glaciihabitans sp.]
MRTLSQPASFWVSAAVVAHALWTSAAPSITYPLYAVEWGLSPAIITAIFAVYPVALVLALLFLGDLSDFIGRRATLLLGLAASFIGVLLFAVAPSVAWVFVGRAFMGIGVALSLSPASAAMIEFSPPGQVKRASSIATAATAVGLALAVLVGGALIQYAPFPTHLNFWVLLSVITALFVATFFLPRHTPGENAAPWRVTLPHIPRGLRGTFATAAIAVTGAYAIGALMLSLGAQIAKELIGSNNALVSGAILALFAVVVGVVATVSKGVKATSAISIGGLATAGGMVLLVLSSTIHSLPVFLAASSICGLGYSLLFLGGLTLISEQAPAHHRAGTLSAVYLVAYLMQGIIALALGGAATELGLQSAIDLGSPFIALIAVGALVLAGLARRRDVGTGLSDTVPSP